MHLLLHLPIATAPKVEILCYSPLYVYMLSAAAKC